MMGRTHRHRRTEWRWLRLRLHNWRLNGRAKRLYRRLRRRWEARAWRQELE
jgi:hypothetical protein